VITSFLPQREIFLLEHFGGGLVKACMVRCAVRALRSSLHGDSHGLFAQN
jgi:hypothetical protein